MFKYVSFLKFKQNEIQGVSHLTQAVRDQMVPVYDVPRSKSIMSEADVTDRIRIADKELQKSQKIAPGYSFIIDNFDIDDTIDLSGIPQYREILTRLGTYQIIPTLAFDRHVDHNTAALDLIKSQGREIAIRLQYTDIESYNLTKMQLGKIWPALIAAQPKSVILLIDLRVIENAAETQRKVERFLVRFKQDFQVTATVVAGSIIPANIAKLIGTDEVVHVPREECLMWRSFQTKPEFNHILYGDYCVVSPEYSDVDLAPELLGRVSTPKAFYPYGDNFCIWRGRRFITHGYDQYFDISDSIVREIFYRGSGYSYGDKYIHERSYLSPKLPSSGGSPSTWIRSLTAAHISFIVNTI